MCRGCEGDRCFDVAVYFDWKGTNDEKIKKACDENDDIEYKGLYAPHQGKYHWVRYLEVKDYFEWMSYMGSKTPPRDRKNLTHSEIEVFTEASL